MKRFIAFALLSALLVSCGEGAVDNKVTTSSDSGMTSEDTTIDMSSVNELPDMKWDGREFRVLGRENATYTQFNNFEIYAESENGDLVNDAVFRRNARIEDKYDVKITQTLVDEPHSALRQAVLAQDDLYDLVFNEIRSIGTLATDGYFYDFNQIDYIDFSKSYWNPDVNEALTVGDSLYFTSSDFSLRDKNRVYIMIYNRDMLEKFKLDDVITKVRGNKWTYDTMYEYVKTVNIDLNSDGAMGIEDNYGIGFDSVYGFYSLMYGFGNSMLRTSNGKLDLAMNNEHMISSIDKALAIAENGFYCGDFIGKVDYDFNSVAGTLFAQQQVLFTTSFPHSLASRSAKCNFNYGVCPFPKYDDEQEKYLAMADVYGMLFSVPVTTPNPEFSGFMLEALSSDSQEVLYNYYELTCKVKHTYDEDSAEMLDIIFDGIVYDLGSIYDIGLKNIWTSISNNKTNNFSSEYASVESSARENLQNILDNFS